jgi:hypothetical protein
MGYEEVDSQMTTIRCGNRYCTNEAAVVDKVCGNLISSPEDKCDYVNYSKAKSVASVRLLFQLPSVSDEVMEQLQEDEEIYIDLNGLKSVTDSDAFFKHTYSEDLGESVSKDLSSLLQSWGLTFGIPSDLTPDPNQSEGPKFDSFVLTLEEGTIQVALEIQMFMQSHQYDMLEWYGKTLAESLMDEEDLIWNHEGSQISLLNVEVD